MPRDWRAVIEDFSRVMLYTHLAARMQPEDAVAIQNEIYRQKKAAYEDGLTAQAAAVGCQGRKGKASPAVLADMMDEAREEALGIINTYNYDLALTIRNIRTEVPTANRKVYAKRLAEWEDIRNEWKSKQIMLYNTTKWYDRAVGDFLIGNPELTRGYAIVEPQTTAVCDVCREWVDKGEVRIEQTTKQMWPAHLNCPHHWVIHYADKVEDCSKLWVGVTVDDWFAEIGEEPSGG